MAGLDVRQQAPHAGPLHLGDLDAVLVDLNNPQTSDVLNLLRARPDLTVIGVNTASGTVCRLAGQVYMAENLEDVIVHLKGADVKKEVAMENA